MYFSIGEGYDAATTESIHLYWHVPATSGVAISIEFCLVTSIHPKKSLLMFSQIGWKLKNV